MQYKLNTAARIVLLQVLRTLGSSSQGNYLYHKNLQQVLNDVSFSDDAEKVGLLEVKDADGKVERLTWDNDYEKEVDISDRLAAQIRAMLQQLDKNEQLLPEHMPVYEMFLEERKAGMEAVDEPGPDAKSS